MLGLLLGRAGIETVVLEKHADFLRDFRGDTVHPSTLQVLRELDLFDAFCARPHQEYRKLRGLIGDDEITVGDFSRLRGVPPFLALMPQWDFLDLLAAQARRYPAFRLEMRADVRDVIVENGIVRGVRAQTPDGEIVVRAELVVGADGRNSTVRERAGLEVQDIGAPIDVLWFRLSRHNDERQQPLGRFIDGRVIVTLERGDYYQCGFVIRKGGFDALRASGIESLREEIARAAPFLRDRTGELRDWNDVSLLTVRIDRLREWYRDGLLCIGDAAHAMSPIAGVGINLAIQDAVAAANILVSAFARGVPTRNDLARVELRRTPPMLVIQTLQALIQERVLGRVLGTGRRLRLPLPLRALELFPALQAIPAWLIGVGVRPEHVRTPKATMRS